MLALLAATILLPTFQPPLEPVGIVIRGGNVDSGTGDGSKVEDIRILGDTIVQIGSITPHKGDRIIDASGLTVCPGFIDAHSHADGGIFDDPDAETQIRQGITTSVVGEDGSSSLPLKDWFGKLRKHPASLNFASFAGQGTIRAKVMANSQAQPTDAQLQQMKALVAQEMKAGARGLSTGLEYEPGRFALTDEIIELSKIASQSGGIYISHVRNEDNQAFEAFAELAQIAKGAKMDAEINHIKLCSSRVWGRAGEVIKMMEANNITADVYPYTYWHSTIRVIIPTQEYSNRALWEQGLKDVGGPEHVLLAAYSPDPSWKGKTIKQLSDSTGIDPITLIQKIIAECYGPGKKGQEGVIVTAMSEDDVTDFVKSDRIMFCSDGGLHDSHPRGAGSFPRVLGVYVRERQALSLTQAIRKMTSLPAWRFGLKDRGRLELGSKADIVLFDPATIADTATVEHPESKPIGLKTVLVNGQVVLEDGNPTHKHSGRPLLKTAR